MLSTDEAKMDEELELLLLESPWSVPPSSSSRLSRS